MTAVLTAVGGQLGDRIGAHRIMVLGLAGFLLLSLPVFAALGLGLGVAAVAYLVFMVAAIGLAGILWIRRTAPAAVRRGVDRPVGPGSERAPTT